MLDLLTNLGGKYGAAGKFIDKSTYINRLSPAYIDGEPLNFLYTIYKTQDVM